MRGYTERTKKLRELSVSAQPRLSMERAVLETEFYKENMGSVSVPVLRAMNFKNYMEKRELYFGDDELIVGEKSIAPQVAPTYPELCCHTEEDLRLLNSREYISFKVSDEDKKIHMEQVLPYWQNRSSRERILANMKPEWKECYASAMFTEFMEQRSAGHTVCDDKIYLKGFSDFKREIEESIANLDFLNDTKALEKKEQLKGMAISCDAIMTLGRRYAEKARQMAEEETDAVRKQELMTIAHNCSVVPENRPENFVQALQMYWFVHLGVTTELNTWDAFSPGKLDQYLQPFYKKEVEAGTLNYDKARELMECFWVKFNNQPAPPKVGVTVKESGTYTDFSNLNTGGINPYTGEDGVNDVSYIILDTMDEMKLLQPSSNVQISIKTPEKFLNRAVEISRKGWGQPAFYNTEELIAELMEAGKSVVDARFGGSSGCVETGAHGRENYTLTGYLNIPKILEVTLNGGVDPLTGNQVGLKRKSATEYTSYEELYTVFVEQIKHFAEIKIQGNNVIEKIFAEQLPATFLSTIINGCIENGRDYNAGGAKYNTRYIQIVGIGTITDSLASIKKNVFEDKHFSMGELMKAMKDDFVGHEMIQNIMLNRTPKYGNDEDYADDLMVCTFNDINDLITGRPTLFGGTYHIDMLPTTCHIYFGAMTGATPNGRKANTPLTDGISPEKGADTNGPTAVIRSASKMDHVRTGGTLLNQKFTPSSIAGVKGIENVSALVRTYFKMGGHHIQFNVVDKAVLLEAQKNPQDYKDLIVRVAGYSDNFNNLEKALQDEIMDRTEQSFDYGCC